MDMTVFMQKPLTLVLGWDETVQPPEIDQAHRTPIPRQNPGERSRTILVHFLRSADRERLPWEGNFSQATQLKRDKFRDRKKALQERNVKFALLYSAILRTDFNGLQRRFDNLKTRRLRCKDGLETIKTKTRKLFGHYLKLCDSNLEEVSG